MKKIILSFVAAAALFTACDPTQSEKDFTANSMTADELSNLISFSQYSMKDSVTAQTDGNWIVYTTHPGQVVTIYNYKADGSENLLAYGKTNGAFMLRPKRGSEPNQTVHLRFVNSDGSIVEAEKQLTVEVASDLTPEMKLLASNDYGSKVWKWDTDFRADGAVWGNMGYLPGSGDSFANEGNGIWWGATPEGLLGQLQHSKDGVAHGWESARAYMTLDDEGTITSYDSTGVKIASGSYEVVGYDGARHPSADGSQSEWSLGTFKVTAGAILWPYQINNNAFEPTEFEIMQLDESHLKLIYAAPGTGSWKEATWWAFKSGSDAQANLTGLSTKDWTWDVDWRADGGAWGNMGYLPGSGDSFANEGNGIWWACPPADLAGQLQHTPDGNTHGYDDAGAYMTFDYLNGTVTSFDKTGAKIASGAYEITEWNNGERISDWKLGTLHTNAGSILWPYQINKNGYEPTDFEIMQLSGNKLKLIYAAPGTGSWSEATWWAFKKK